MMTRGKQIDFYANLLVKFSLSSSSSFFSVIICCTAIKRKTKYMYEEKKQKRDFPLYLLVKKEQLFVIIDHLFLSM
jgi:hypothetical protein